MQIVGQRFIYSNGGKLLYEINFNSLKISLNKTERMIRIKDKLFRNISLIDSI